jgi:hypothetical protein
MLALKFYVRPRVIDARLPMLRSIGHYEMRQACAASAIGLVIALIAWQ